MLLFLKKSAKTISARTTWPFILIILVGFVLQIRQYVANRSIWVDEAMLANNVIAHSLRFLLTQPLESEQAAPPGFLFSLKLVGKIFGYQDQIFRLVPLCFGIAILPIAFLLGKRFKHSLTQFIFITLIAISPVLTYYSVEVKQYILDVFFTTLLLWIGLSYRRWKHGNLLLLICGSLAIIFSNPSIFVLAAIGITQSILNLHRRDWKAFLRLAAIGAVWLFFFGATYWISTHGILENIFLKTYWQDAFAPLPFSLTNLKWYLDSALGLAYLGFSTSAPGPIGIPSAWYAPSNWIILASLVIGGYGLFRRDREWFSINFMTIFLAFFASGLHLYPFRSRPALYFIPILYSLLSAFVDLLWLTPSRLAKTIAGVGASFFLWLLLIPAFQLFLQPTNISDIKGALAYITQHHEAGDQIAISEWSEPAYRFYQPAFPLESLTPIDFIPTENDPDAFTKSLCLHQQFRRTWIVFTHRFSERIDFLARLKQVATLIDQWESPDSGAYLFDFSQPTFCPQ